MRFWVLKQALRTIEDDNKHESLRWHEHIFSQKMQPIITLNSNCMYHL